MTVIASDRKLRKLLQDIRACRLCEAHLPLGPNPVLRAAASARVLVVGQAPGTRVHNTGIPWNDPSGDRLRLWMDVDRETFYDETRIAIVPTGFCYPGKGKSGDMPPRPECAPHWHPQILPQLPKLELILLIGQYAQKYYLPDDRRSLTERVRAADAGPRFLSLPHPSPRNQMWLRRNPWFDADIVPELRRRLQPLL